MAITVDVAYKSLNKFNEVLCGDKVELLKTEDSNGKRCQGQHPGNAYL